MNGIFSQFLFFIYIQTIWHDYMALDAQAAKIIKSIDLTHIHFIKKNPNPSDSNPFIYLNWKHDFHKPSPNHLHGWFEILLN